MPTEPTAAAEEAREAAYQAYLIMRRKDGWFYSRRDLRDAPEFFRAGFLAAAAPPAPAGPIPMILHCPACGLQHVDAPDSFDMSDASDHPWTNPPHRSHLCHGCGHIWRPADVPTEGVAAITTRGEADSPPPAPAGLAGREGVRDEQWTVFVCAVCGKEDCDGHVIDAPPPEGKELRTAAGALLEMVDVMIKHAPHGAPGGHVLEPYADRLRLALAGASQP